MPTFLSFWRHGSNTVLAVAALALIVLFAVHALAFAPASLIAVGIGALVFFVSEYTTHRFMLHAPPHENAFVLKLQHRLHYDHHIEPARLDLLFLPLWFAIPVASQGRLRGPSRIARCCSAASSACCGTSGCTTSRTSRSPRRRRSAGG